MSGTVAVDTGAAGAVGSTSRMHDLLARLSAQTSAELQAVGRTVRYPAGTTVMFAGQVGDSVHVLLDGYARVVGLGPVGKQTLLGLRGPGDLLGEMAVLDGGARSSLVVAATALDTFMVPAEPFRDALRRSPDLAAVVIDFLIARLRDADAKRAEFLALDSTGRIAARIAELADRLGEPADDGISVSLPMTQAELAGWAGTSIESAGRALATLRKLGWIETERRRIVVRELDALRLRASI